MIDTNPQVRHAAILAHYSPKVPLTRAVQQVIEREAATSKDTYLRQAATFLLAEKATFKELETLCGRADAPVRLAGVLAVGSKLTIPPAHKPLAQHLLLAKLREESAYVIDYADGKLDLRSLAASAITRLPNTGRPTSTRSSRSCCSSCFRRC